MKKALKLAADAILERGERLTDEQRQEIERTLRLFAEGGRG